MSAEEGIAKTNAEFVTAFNEGNPSGVAACYSEDGQFMVPGVPTMDGREAIANGLKGLMDSGVTGIELKTNEVFDFGDNAIEVGEYKLYAGDSQADHGRFLVYWQNIDGKWYLKRDTINSLSA
ncbi:YybH family protein [Pseudemcibacter aquimaris]|uniref:YybH family protein n=1 Tax=Pseudemcibacter aquimaris TaxID=2857064 RepID=UPI002012E7F4|nr:SgcJ/EcaC family oxidoreductase [Pseudemcibacter aquimaris]MCC3861150.1 SgcJ/EcaC family oxidoreductase [Pseudemcibacter aquimaris]WDU59967.1 SgcJ/EcaC family oxidoreductase [Pseudemcibacter aquimaris]